MKILRTRQGTRAHLADYLSYTHKECSLCGEVKPVGDFGKTRTKTKLGWAWRSRCRECNRQYCKEYGQENKQKRNARLRAWRRKNPDAARAKDRRARYKSKYSLTIAQVRILKEHRDGACWICGEVPNRLFIDHCHATGRVRGCLCPSCNSFLGRIESNPQIFSGIKTYLDQPCHADVLLELANR